MGRPVGGSLHLHRVIDYTVLPAVNATLNAISTVFLTVGWLFIRQRQVDRHRRCMLGAFTTSALFLTSYVVYHANVGSVPFTGQGVIRVGVLHHPHHARGARRRDSSVGPHHVIARAGAAIRSASKDRALDTTTLAVRVGDRSRDLCDVVSIDVIAIRRTAISDDRRRARPSAFGPTLQ